MYLQLMCGGMLVITVAGDVADDPLKDIADQGYRVIFKPVGPARLCALITHMLRQKNVDISTFKARQKPSWNRTLRPFALSSVKIKLTQKKWLIS